MKFKTFNEEERRAYQRGKISGYYSRKAHERRVAKASSPVPVKYAGYTADQAMQAAFRRTYDNK